MLQCEQLAISYLSFLHQVIKTVSENARRDESGSATSRSSVHERKPFVKWMHIAQTTHNAEVCAYRYP